MFSKLVGIYPDEMKRLSEGSEEISLGRELPVTIQEKENSLPEVGWEDLSQVVGYKTPLIASDLQTSCKIRLLEKL